MKTAAFVRQLSQCDAEAAKLPPLVDFQREVLPDLDKINARLRTLCGKINLLKIITPIHIDWSAPNPRFFYDQDLLNELGLLSPRLGELSSRLDNYTPDSHAADLYQWLLARRVAYLQKILLVAECVQNGDDERLADIYAQIFERQDQETLMAARYFLRHGGEIKTDNPAWLSQAQAYQLTQLSFDALAIKQFFTQALKFYGLENRYAVVITNKRQLITVSADQLDSRAIVYIPARRQLNGGDLLRLIAHEIETHVLDNLNREGLLRYLMPTNQAILYEGRAMASDVACGVGLLGRTQILIPKCLLITAIDAALRGANFAQTQGLVLETIKTCQLPVNNPLMLARQTAYRIFRGVSDPSRSSEAVFTKDQAYMTGWLLVDKLQKLGLDHYLDIGASQAEELVMILRHYRFDNSMLIYRRRDFVRTLAAELLSAAAEH